MNEPIISADSHMDLGWLPSDTFTSRVSASWRPRVAQIVATPVGERWVADGVVLSGVRAVGSKGRPYAPGRWVRADKMAEAGLFTDGRSRPADPDARLEDQDRDGVSAEVLYGLFGVTTALADQELAAVILAAYNDWLVEFCAHHPDRYIGLACLPTHDAGAVAKEIVRTHGMGLPGGVLDVKNAYRPVWHRDWDPVWDTAQALDYPISFHSARTRADAATSVVGQMDAPAGAAVIEAAIGMSLLQFHGSADYFGIIFGGALDRFPRLKIVLGESGVGWIPSLLERMDWQYDNEFRELGLEMKPSGYWHRQMWATFQSDAVGMNLLSFLGEDRVMYASDYPHPDGSWPDTREIVAGEMAHLGATSRRKMLYENAAGLYRRRVTGGA